MGPSFPFCYSWDLSYPSDLPQARWFNLVRVCVVIVDDCKPMMGCFFFFFFGGGGEGGLLLLWLMGVGCENTCAVSGKLNVSRVIPRLYKWVYKTLRLLSLMGFQSRRSQAESHG